MDRQHEDIVLVAKVGIIVAARMGSSRFPGKPLQRLMGREILGIILDRVRSLCPNVDLSVATSDEAADDEIEKFCYLEGVPCFRGSEDRVADRLIAAAKKRHLDFMVRMNGDRPLFDDENLIFAIRLAAANVYDFISNKLDNQAVVKPGFTTEVFRVNALERTLVEDGAESDQEHVTTALYRNADKLRCFTLSNELTYCSSELQLEGYALDTIDDLKSLEKLLLRVGKLRTVRVSDFARSDSSGWAPNVPFLIAEIGGNHEGDFEYAKRLTELAAKSRAHSVKFQLYTGDSLVNPILSPDRNRHFKKFELTLEQHEALAQMCVDAGKIYSASVWNYEHLEALDQYLGYYKVGSGDLTNWHLIKEFASREKPIVLSTGLAQLGEVVQVVNYIRRISDYYEHKNNLVVLQCTSMYPIGAEDANLSVMPMLEESLDCAVGYSDHTVGLEALKSAVSRGATTLEFHFTDDRAGKEFRDQKCSKTKQEIESVWQFIEDHVALTGSPIKQPTPVEISTDHVTSFRRAVYYNKPIPAGQVVTEHDISFLRPANDLHPHVATKLILGRKLTRDVNQFDPVSGEDST
jgi:N,N'-diacetyllegionaminate synthase